MPRFYVVDTRMEVLYSHRGFGEGWQLSEADLTKSRGLRISLSISHDQQRLPTKPCIASTLAGPSFLYCIVTAQTGRHVSVVLPARD